MYNARHSSRTSINVNESSEGETIEDKVSGIVNNGEGLDEGADLIYTERKDGVLPQYDIRTDRWEVAVAASDFADKTHKAKREERHSPKKEEETKTEPKEAQDTPNGGAKSE